MIELKTILPILTIVILIATILVIHKNCPSNNKVLENFENGEENSETQDNLDEMRKYMKIHGLYPMDQGIDMSKYVLKSSVDKSTKCPDMSKYIPKSAVPRQVKCPEINRDEWVRKSELPPNWNKECPAQPDLTNYVLKSTIPPTQKCPSCICPKVKVNAGLCREPTKEDCIKSGALKDACPKPEPCPVPKCPEPKPCPVPKDPVCPKCPEAPVQGKCPEPERCPPAKDCPKCYSVKYVKVPVVKSEPPPKPQKETIFPQNLIETKLIRQHVPRQPRQPKILSLESTDEERNAMRNELRNEIMEEIARAPKPSIQSDMNSNNNRGLNNNREMLKQELLVDILNELEVRDNSENNTNVNENMNENMNNNQNINKVLDNMMNNDTYAAPIMTEENMFPSFTQPAKCNSANLNRAFKNFGKVGFNTNL